MASRAHRWKGDDNPLTGVHGGTIAGARRAIAEAKLLDRDARRYADWVARGKPPSPSMPPRKDRRRPQATLRGRLLEAQDGRCGICDCSFDETSVLTLDHVTPRALGGKNVGNLLLVHSTCNGRKGDRRPTCVELQRLATVNARLGVTPPR